MNAKVRFGNWNPLSAFVSGLIAVSVGLGILSFGQWSLIRTREFIAPMVKAQGTVIDVVSRTEMQNGERKTYFYPVVEFRTANGEVIRFEGSTGSNPPSYSVGDVVAVLYDPQTPQSAVIDSWELWLGPTIVIVGGSLFVLVGGLTLLNVLFTLLKLGSLIGLLAILLHRKRQQ